MVATLSRLRSVPTGVRPTAALIALVSELKAGDPLRPVTVVMPSALSAVSVRRSLGRDGFVATEFVTLPSLVPRLAARQLARHHREPVHDLEARMLVRAVLADGRSRLSVLGRHPSTLAALVDTFAELRSVRAADLAALAARSRRAAEVVDAYRAYQRAVAGRADDHDAVVAATAAVVEGEPVVDEIGAVVLHLPRRLDPTELDLVRALAAREQLWAIVNGPHLATELESLLGPRADVERDESLVPEACAISAPDAAEEARIATRLVLDHLRAGVPADRIAVVARVAHPYSLLVHEELAAAGVDHSAPGPVRLSQSIAGRTLLALLAWSREGHRRDHLMRMLRAAPVRDPAGGKTHPHKWDRLARNAGVVGGLDQWRFRVEEAKRARLEWATASLVDTGAVPDTTHPELPFDGADPDVVNRLQELDALRSFVERLAAATDPGGRHSWRAFSAWARSLVDDYLGRATVAAAWSEPERRAREAVLDVLRDLARFDGVGPAPDVDEFIRILTHELERPSARVGRFGHGVFVGRLVDAVGADLDVLIVLGAAEGIFPPTGRDDALLPDRERAAAGGALRPRRGTLADEERDLLTALAGATHAYVTVPRTDARNQRALQPSALSRAIAGPRLEVASFEWWLASGRTPASGNEFDVAELLRARAAGHTVGQLPIVGAAGLQRGLMAATARAQGDFGAWSGFVGPWPELVSDLDHPRSPTALQQWATCPFSYFLARVLGLRELEDPGEAETITPMDRGSLVHAILERFFRERLGRRADTAWTEADYERLLEVADELEDTFRSRGLTGRPLLWNAEWAALRRHLRRILDADGEDERLVGVAPVAVELGFGHEGEPTPPVRIDLGDGRLLHFGGRIDRIDRSPDGRKLVVLDYKTGSAWDYGVLDPNRNDFDIVARGKLLQLPIYALAARAEYPDAEEVEAYYWFVGQRGAIEMKGGPIDDTAKERFESVVRTIVDGIEAGQFPARPGEDQWRPNIGPTHGNCLYCAFDPLCSTTRGEQWLTIRTRDELAPYVELAEGDPPSRGDEQ